MPTEALQRVLRAIETIKRGQMVIMMDDKHRENEGDLVYAATFSTPDMVNFMAREARGLICAPVSQAIADRLDLTPMVAHNDANHETAFTVSIDSVTATTGISAAERSDCIVRLANPQTVASDFVRPGHVFPLIAKDGGTLVRTGHTEGSVDLCKLAGLVPAAVVCEIIKDDGAMARRDDVQVFAERHALPIVYVSDLVEYRLAHEKLIDRIDASKIHFRSETVQQIRWRDHLDRIHVAVVFGKLNSTATVKFHNIGRDIDLILDDTHHAAMEHAIDHLIREGGVLIFLDTKTISKEQAREFGVGAQILKDLGIQNIRLLTSNTGTEFVGLSGFGLDVVEKIEVF